MLPPSWKHIWAYLKIHQENTSAIWGTVVENYFWFAAVAVEYGRNQLGVRFANVVAHSWRWHIGRVPGFEHKFLFRLYYFCTQFFLISDAIKSAIMPAVSSKCSIIPMSKPFTIIYNSIILGTPVNGVLFFMHEYTVLIILSVLSYRCRCCEVIAFPSSPVYSCYPQVIMYGLLRAQFSLRICAFSSQ